MQGEDARCFAPWAGHDPTPHEPWPALHAESRAEKFAAPPAVAPNLAIRRQPREYRRPLNGTAFPLNEFGLTDIRSLRHRLRARAARPARRQAHRLRQKRLPGWNEIARPRQPGSERRSRAGRERRSPPKNTEARRPTEILEPTAELSRSRIPPPPPSHDPGNGTVPPRFAVRRVD